MYVFSLKSQDELDACNSDQIRLWNEVIKYRDCTILCGRRGREEQNKKFKEGKSKVKYPDSPHNKIPSDAVDATPYPFPRNWGRISWELIPKKYHKQIRTEIKELCKYYDFNGYVAATADQLGVKIRQGHDWDGDNDFNDQTFDDLVHNETVRE